MPHFYFREIWTPLKLIGIKIFKDDQGDIWYKVFSKSRRRVR